MIRGLLTGIVIGAGFCQLGAWVAALIGWLRKRSRIRRGVWHVTLEIRGKCTHDFYLAERISVAHVVLSRGRLVCA